MKNYEKEEKDPVWLVTFADAMSLMLTFFVMLYAATSLEKAKFEPVFRSFKGALGVMQETKPAVISPVEIVREEERIAQMIRKVVLSEGMEEVDVKVVEGGVRVNLRSPILFDLGKADLKKDVLPLLDGIADILKEMSNQIIIEGHTDNLPIRTEKFPSNWELSAARAISAAKYLISRGIIPSRIGVVGYADVHPLFPNDTPEHRSANRRVEIFIKTNAY